MFLFSWLFLGGQFLKAWHSDGWRVSFLFCEIFNSSKKTLFPQLGRPEILPKLLNSCGKFLKACNRSKWSIWDLARFSQKEIHRSAFSWILWQIRLMLDTSSLIFPSKTCLDFTIGQSFCWSMTYQNLHFLMLLERRSQQNMWTRNATQGIPA